MIINKGFFLFEKEKVEIPCLQPELFKIDLFSNTSTQKPLEDFK